MSNKRVYLSGPIAGLSYDGATGWRETVAEYLSAFGIVALDPMRSKTYLKNIPKLSAQSLVPGEVMSTARGITTRDRFDCLRADVMLVNLTQVHLLTSPSLGTVMEMGWADAMRIPIVCARDPKVYDHPMINEVIGFDTKDIWSALDIVVDLLK